MASIEERERSHWQFTKLLPIWIVILALIISNLLKGSKKSSSIAGISLCSPVYWVIYFLFVIICACCVFYSFKHAIKDFEQKRACGYKFEEGDLVWTHKTTIVLLVISLIGGATTAIVGIGGGVIYTPLLLEFGVHPKVTTSTSLFLVLYTSLSNTI